MSQKNSKICCRESQRRSSAMSEEQKNAFYQIIRGLPCPASSRYKKKNIEDAMDLIPEDGDIILASYPKTGTTWMQYIILQIKSEGKLFPSFDDVTYEVVPFIELTGVAAVYAQDKPRFYKHHIAYNFVKKNDQSKVIYIYRHPEDTVVSYYHFTRSLIPDFPLDFNEFFNNFLTGKKSYGNYFEHVLSFYEHRKDRNLLMISYENLQSNRRNEILKIAKFLGDEYYQNLLADDELLEKIMQRTTFDYMKKHLYFTHPDIKAGVRKSQDKSEPEVIFFRKGVAGDGKASLTDSQRQFLKKAAKKILQETSIMFEWYHE